ncbi:hypothetical protein RvY_12733 [Ramazzottius varieornatus]|uniref:Iron-binding zinc finger CDGSH type domain-containing protein n=1 Tax=Ramazzottius varieornatus TaxID=947166 RepID=A0A1D1VMH7_RAMVA|nr:hypothetical protein RvY_12733 [Ramazzottius varieornatus]
MLLESLGRGLQRSSTLVPNQSRLLTPSSGQSLRIQARRTIRYDEYLEMEKWQHTRRREDVETSLGSYQTDKGKIYSKHPFRFTVEYGKKYSWCSCGYAHAQPFCDGACTKPWVQNGLKPVTFLSHETKDVWFCNCKQTGKKPWCDNTCETPAVKDARDAY